MGIPDVTPVPVGGPTAADVAQSGKLPAGGVAAVFRNTVADETNKRAEQDVMNQRKSAFIELVRRGKEAADIAYNGAPEYFGDPDVQKWLPDPESPAYIDQQTGQFSFTGWANDFNDGRKDWLKHRDEKAKTDAELQIKRETQAGLNARSAASLALKEKLANQRDKLAKQLIGLKASGQQSLVAARDKMAIAKLNEMKANASEEGAKYQALLTKALEVKQDPLTADYIRLEPEGELVPVDDELIYQLSQAVADNNNARAEIERVLKGGAADRETPPPAPASQPKPVPAQPPAPPAAQPAPRPPLSSFRK